MLSEAGPLGAPGALWAAGIAAVLVLAAVVRRKWRRATERAEEVRMLVKMAAEEAAMAEWEARRAWMYERRPAEAVVRSEWRGHGSVAKVAMGPKQCAICHNPTTTRCSRCKAVRYCSGRCQIIHWRQGHKDDCRPPDNIKDDIQESIHGPDVVDSLLSDSIVGNLDTFSTKLSGEIAGSHSSFVSSFSSIFSEDQTADDAIAGGDSCSVASTSSSDICTPIHNEKPCSTSRGVADTSLNPVEVINSSRGCRTIESGEVENISADCVMQSPHCVPTISFLSRSSLSCKSTTKPGCDSVPLSNSMGLGEYWNATSSVSSECPSVTDGSSLNSASDLTDLSLLKSRNKEVENKHPQISLNKSVELSSSQKSSTIDTTYEQEDGLVTCSYDNMGESNPRYKTPEPPANCHPTATQNFIPGGLPLASSRGTVQPNKFIVKPGPAVTVGSSFKMSVRKAAQQLRHPRTSNSSKMLFPYELFIKLYNEKLELHPCGFVNLGNSCYANAVLQCLIFTRPLAAYLLQGLHNRRCLKKEWCFICEFEGLVIDVKRGRSSLSPTGILSQIHNIGSHLIHGKQEDAHEFLRYAIDAMQRVCLKEPGADEFGKIAEETSLIQLTFGGYLRSKIKCLRCNVKSERFERMMDLTVEIYGDIGSLDDALNRFTSTELLDGENKYRCDRCKSYVRAKKKLTVAEAPNILTIVLKRFQSGKFGKINKAVKFPEYLNLAPYMNNPSDKSPVYNLYAVVVHVDIMNAAFSGHYVCYVKNFQGRWFKADDSSVKPVDLEKVLSKGAYMLLYARCSPRAPCLMWEMMSKDLANLKSRSFNSSIISDRVCASLIPRSNSSLAWDEVHRRVHRSPTCQAMSDSSSDSSLLSCSDEGSCSTESTRGSTSTDDYSGNFSPSRFSVGSDCSLPSDCQPNLNERRPELRGGESSTSDCSHPFLGECINARKITASHSTFLPFDKANHCCRKLTEQCGARQTDQTNPCKTESSSLIRRPTRDKAS